MNTTAREADGRRRRRRHSPEFKADAIAACRRAGVSIAAVAMSRGLNANLLRRWVAESEREADNGGTIEPPPSDDESRTKPATQGFVPLALPPSMAVPAATAQIRVELRRGGTAITVTWPSSAAAECACWMRELLR